MFTVVTSYVTVLDTDGEARVVDAGFAAANNLNLVGPSAHTRAEAWKGYIHYAIGDGGAPDVFCKVHDCSAYECTCAWVACDILQVAAHGIF